MKAKILNWLIICFGVILIIYGFLGVERYGFYISGRGGLGQLEGGLAPVFIILGIFAVVYGVVELKLKISNEQKKVDE